MSHGVNGGGVVLFGIFLSFFLPSRGSFWFIVFPIVLISGLYSPISLSYGPPDYQSLISLLATNFAETTEFLTLVPIKGYLRSVLIILIAFSSHYIGNKFQLKPWRNKTYVFISLALLIICLEPSHFVRKSVDATRKVTEQLNELKKFSSKSSWTESFSSAPPTDYVLVIGESARKDYFHSYGYPIENTPFLDSHFTVKVDGLKAAGSYTIGSLTKMLTVPQKDSQEARYDRSLIDLAKSAGIKTFWISNQGMLGKYDTPVSAIGMKSDQTIFLNKEDYTKKNLSDFELLKPLKKVLYQRIKGSRLIVLHTLGSHPNACHRVRDINKPYKVEDDRFSYIACYVTSIKKTDMLLEKIYNFLKERHKITGRQFSIIYFSDHGQVHRTIENKIFLNNNKTSKYHFDVPLFLINSDGNGSNSIKSQKSGLNFTEGLANWMGISNPQLQRYDLFDGKDDPDDYGLSKRIEKITTPSDPAIDISAKIKTLNSNREKPSDSTLVEKS